MRLQGEMATNAMIRISVEDSRQRASGTALVLAVQGDGFAQVKEVEYGTEFVQTLFGRGGDDIEAPGFSGKTNRLAMLSLWEASHRLLIYPFSPYETVILSNMLSRFVWCQGFAPAVP
jgi:hypothetical protein